MNYFTLFPLQGYWGKFVGFGISLTSLILLLLHSVIGSDFLIKVLSPDKQLVSLLWFFSLGLFMLSFSKEKIDDERVQLIRYTALRGMALICLIGLFSVYSPFVIDDQGFSRLAKDPALYPVLMLIVTPLLTYQLIFNIGLQLNPSWAYNDLSAEENIKKNPKFFLIYAIATIVILAAFLIMKALN